jgi:hypothetical protein
VFVLFVVHEEGLAEEEVVEFGGFGAHDDVDDVVGAVLLGGEFEGEEVAEALQGGCDVWLWLWWVVGLLWEGL